jgi:MtN3 and saliva related transmembrane protein
LISNQILLIRLFAFEYCRLKRNINTVSLTVKEEHNGLHNNNWLNSRCIHHNLAFPQLIKVWKTKSTKDISTGMFSLFCGGVFLWFVYGVFVNDLPIMIADSLAFIQARIILMFKAKYK